MINFFKNLVLDFFLRRKFKISARKIKKYKKAKLVFETFLLDSGVVVTGDDYRKIKDDIPSLYQYEKDDLTETDHLIVPEIILHFLRNGGTWNEIDKCGAVLKHNTFYSKAR